MKNIIVTPEGLNEALSEPKSVVFWKSEWNPVSIDVQEKIDKLEHPIDGFYEADIDSEVGVKMSQDAGIVKLPTLDFYEDGLLMNRIAGDISQKQLETTIGDFLKS